MGVPTDPYRVLVVACCLSALLTVGPLGGQAAGSSVETLVVDADGEGYDDIGAAVEAATDGDRIEVRPGTYPGRVTVDRSVSIVAPEGALVRGEGSGAGIRIATTGVTVDGLAVRGFAKGIAVGTAGSDWTLRDVEVTNCTFGVYAAGANGAWRVTGATLANNEKAGLYVFGGSRTGTMRDLVVRDNEVGLWVTPRGSAWTLRNATVTGNDRGVVASVVNPDWPAPEDVSGGSSLGAWSISGSEFRNDGVGVSVGATSLTDWSVEDSTFVSVGVAVDATHSGGDWRVENVTIRDSRRVGIDAVGAAGNWTVANAVVAGTDGVGIYAPRTRGAWTIRNSVVADTTASEPFPGSGTGIYAADSSASWRIEGSVVVDNARHGVNATGAGATGPEEYERVNGSVVTVTPNGTREPDATGNWWGRQSGPTDEQCVGTVDCSDHLKRRARNAPEYGNGTDSEAGTTATETGTATGTDRSEPTDDGTVTTVGTGSGPVSVVVPVVAGLLALVLVAVRRYTGGGD